MVLWALLTVTDPYTSLALVVYLHVIPQRSLARKVLLTDLTLKGFLASMDPQMIVEVAPVVELTATFFAFKRSFSCRIQGDFKQLATESRQPRFIAQIDILITSVLLSSKSRAARKKRKIMQINDKKEERLFLKLGLRPSYSRLRRTPLARKLKKNKRLFAVYYLCEFLYAP